MFSAHIMCQNYLIPFSKFFLQCFKKYIIFAFFGNIKIYNTFSIYLYRKNVIVIFTNPKSSIFSCFSCIIDKVYKFFKNNFFHIVVLLSQLQNGIYISITILIISQNYVNVKNIFWLCFKTIQNYFFKLFLLFFQNSANLNIVKYA